jgi:hypothetical protein
MIMKRRREREGARSAHANDLKFQNFPTVVTSLSLEQWRNAHSANRPDRSIKSAIIAMDIEREASRWRDLLRFCRVFDL